MQPNRHRLGRDPNTKGTGISGVDPFHTGPDTLAGRYLRNFWQPVARARDLKPGEVKRVQVMGEYFTLFRDEHGEFHLVADRCAHRGTRLSTGWVEGEHIVCRYHGWKYCGLGHCVDQPGEHESFAAKIHIRGFPVEVYLGLVFAYLGEREPPRLPRHKQFEGDGWLEVMPPEEWPTNLMVRMENAIDLSHVLFAHKGTPLAAIFPTMPQLECVETAYGVRTVATFPGHAAIYGPNYYFPPNANQFKAPIDSEVGVVDHLGWRVPTDDEHYLSYTVAFVPVTGAAATRYHERNRGRFTKENVEKTFEVAEAVLAGKVRIEDMEHRTDINLITLEDYVVQVGQGTLDERIDYRLGRGDVGVIMVRNIWLRELAAFDQGRPTKQWTRPDVLD